MFGILITLSQKRLEMLEEDPEALADVIEARDEEAIPGLLDIGTTWDALDLILSDRGKDPVLSDAVLARSGRALYPGSTFDKARVLGPERVGEIARHLEKLPKTIVKDRYPQLAAKSVHGRLGKDPDEIPGLEEVLRRVVRLYAEATKAKHSMLCVVV